MVYLVLHHLPVACATLTSRTWPPTTISKVQTVCPCSTCGPSTCCTVAPGPAAARAICCAWACVTGVAGATLEDGTPVDAVEVGAGAAVDATDVLGAVEVEFDVPVPLVPHALSAVAVAATTASPRPVAPRLIARTPRWRP